MQWQYSTQHIPQDISDLEQMLLERRGIRSEADRNAFFSPKAPLTFSPEEVGLDAGSLQAAVERIAVAKERNEEVVIFGDYDVDGVCSTAILWEALRAVGIIAKPFLPHREKHGYGLSMRSLDAVLAEHTPKLLITVDNGIVAHQAFAELKRLGIDTILTDHHQPEAELPNASIIVHSTQICGSGVAWFLARALSEAAAEKSQDLLALATIADQMPLLGANRSFVIHGLEALKRTERVGLELLMSRAAVDTNKISAETVNYVIAPRINAMGRLKHSLNALRLVCTTSVQRAAELVSELNDTNSARQDLTSEMIDHAMQQAALWQEKHIIVVAAAEYHEGVIGLLASKLTEEFHKPTIAISIGEKFAKASARSIHGINIIELIRLIKDDLLEAGGHPMAAGFSADPTKIDIVTRRLEEVAMLHISAEALQPKLAVELELPASLVSMTAAELIGRFAPFGNSNPEPVFALPTATVLQAAAIGRESRHLRLEIALQCNEQQQKVSCIGWGMAKHLPSLALGTAVRVAGSLTINEWKSRRNVQVMVKDIAFS